MIKYVLITLTILNTLPAIGAAFDCATIKTESTCTANTNCTWFSDYDSSNSKWIYICTNDMCAKNKDVDTCVYNNQCVWDEQYNRCTGCGPNAYHDGTGCVLCDIPTGATLTETNANLTTNKCKWTDDAPVNYYFDTNSFGTIKCPPNKYSDPHYIKGEGKSNIQYSTDNTNWNTNPITCDTKKLTIKINNSEINATCDTPYTNPDISNILGEHAIKEPLMFEIGQEQYTWEQACNQLNNGTTIYPVLKKKLQLNISGTASDPTITIDCEKPEYNETITPPIGYTISEPITFTKYDNKIATDTETTGETLSDLCKRLNSGTTITPVYTENVYNVCYVIGYSEEDCNTKTYTDIKTEDTKKLKTELTEGESEELALELTDDEKNALIKCTNSDNEYCYECYIYNNDDSVQYKGQIKIGDPLSNALTDDNVNTAVTIKFFVTNMIECPENHYCPNESEKRQCPMGKRSPKNSTEESHCTYDSYTKFCDNNGCYQPKP